MIFEQLDKSEIARIIDVQLEKLRKNLAERGITIFLEDSAKELLVKEGYDPIYGARPLKRAIQTMIQNPLAIKILNGDILSGSSIRISAENSILKFTPEASTASA